MPTWTEQDELRNNCTWDWYYSGNTEFNGVAGYKVTGKKSGYTERFIFLPAAGYRNDTDLNDVGYLGTYWSSSFIASSPYSGRGLYFNSADYSTSGIHRYCGCSVRPVCP